MRVFLSLFLVVLSCSALAEFKIGVLNMDKLRKESQAINAVRKEIEAYRSKIHSEITALQTKIMEEDAELSSNKDKMPRDVFVERRGELQLNINKLHELARRRRESLDNAYISAMDVVNDSVNKILKKVANEHHFALIINSDQVSFFQGSLDVTDTVVKMLNKELPTLKVPIKLD